MKKTSMLLMLLLAMTIQSHHVIAQSVTITLIPGYNWISIPCADTLDFATALGSFTPAEGDVIKSQWSNVVYRNGQWIGQISKFYPGYGYMYKSNRPMPITLTFNVQPPAPQVIVTTMEPTEITAISAISGGSLTSSDGSYIVVLEKGICWATHPNPTVMNDFHTENGSGINSFTAEMTDLDLNTVYYLRAYAVTDGGTTYGEEMSFITRDGIPVVSTDSITNVGGTSATCWGTVTDNGGLNVIERGVCWSITHNPTLNDSYVANNSGLGNFSSIISELSLHTTYYVRTYATTNQTVAYGEEVSVITHGINGGHAYVDLGLPSGTLWATCNVGANAPEDYGNYYAWGETLPKGMYYWDNYQHCNGSSSTLTKYCVDPDHGYNSFTDNLTILLPEDDAATANWGADWRMPTKEEWQELLDNTTCTWTIQNGVTGRLFIASNGNCLFLPAAGFRNGRIVWYEGSVGRYGSSSLYIDDSSYAWQFQFVSDDLDLISGDRSIGRSVRAVCSATQK